ncbi:MAG: response regulator [SAR324 cluster bacterium]|nr:response regulator [SAR324 cluster bacterium]
MLSAETRVHSILIVDDDPSIRKLLLEVLKRTPHEVDSAIDGENGFQKYIERYISRDKEADDKKRPYDLMIVDLKMPRMDGRALIQNIRQTNLDLAFIVLTGHGDLTQANLLLTDYGISDFLLKPLEHPDQLLFSITNALEKRRLNLELKAQYMLVRDLTIERGKLIRKLELRVEQSQMELKNEREQRLKIAEELAQHRTLLNQWNAIPAEIQNTMEDVLNRFGSDVNYLDPELLGALIRMTSRYGNNLSQFIKISKEQDLQSIHKRQERIDLLKKLPLFSQLNAFDLITLTEKMREMEVPADTILLTQGQPADKVYFVEAGDLEILVNDELVAHRTPGDSVGEMSCLRGEENASATVRALTPCRILQIERDEFMEVVNRLPQLWQQVFRDMSQRLTDSNQRTSELFQHSSQGLMKIDPTGNVTNEYSLQCTHLLGTRQLMGKSAESLLFPDNQRYQEEWRLTFTLLFEDTVMGFDMLTDMFPKETTIVLEGKTREYLLSYYPCCTAEKKLVALDVGIDDVTQERILAREGEQLKKERAVVQKIYEDPDSFLQFLRLAEATTESVKQFVQCLSETPTDDTLTARVDLMRQLHTLKGISGIFLFERLQKIAHELEEALRRDNQNAPLSDKTQLEEGLNQLEAQIRYAQALLDTMQPEMKRRMTGVVLSREQFALLKEMLQQEKIPRAWQIVNQVDLVPVKKLTQHWPDEIAKLSQQLGKLVKFRIHETEPVAIKKSHDLLEIDYEQPEPLS